jgi:hypothetical protein
MKYLDYLINLNNSVEKFLGIQWTLWSLLIVIAVLVIKNIKVIFLILHALFHAKSVYKFFFDKSERLKGETFLLSFNNSVTIDEAKQIKQYEALTRIRLDRKDEKSYPIKLKLQTSLYNKKVGKRDSHVYMFNDKPDEMVVMLSNETFESLYKKFNEDGMRVFIEFIAYKAMSRKAIDMYNFMSLDFQILEREDFRKKITLMMFLEVMEEDLNKQANAQTSKRQKRKRKK